MMKVRKQSGFLLIEALIAIVLITFGLLGVAGVLTKSLKNVTSSYYQTQASWLASEMTDRMRANRTVAEAGGYTLALTATPPTASPSNIALTDQNEWITKVASSLPSGKGSIAIDGLKKVTVIVQWDDSRTGDVVGSTSRQVKIEARL